MSCSQAFKAQRCETEADLKAVSQAADYLGRPAPRKWIAGRVVSLLSHYFVSQQDETLAAAVAEDWCAMLADYPAWAIANACRWWMSRENPRKHCKPLPGDIQDRAHIEMEPVRAARITIARGVALPKPQPAARPEITEEERARRAAVVASLGLKRIGGEA
ncbi:hypothetical protein EG244_15990 [Falsigemmobacter faecalis]|uniref:Uncharacterized protein n=1 Tax=Falsigemmobacter faecalis TaxID=2488730 RepID=A0A3P3DDV1_9RHOB|nr:hypothetical protein EG244_15990 [Falsigemmobacter faecalis]